MTTLRKLLFFFLILVILGAGGCSQTEEIEQKQFTSEKLLQISKLEQPTIEELIQSAEQGDVEAQYELGKLYDTGKGVPTGEGVPTDHLEAAKWYRKAAEQGYASAQFNLGLHYYNGQGVPRDYVLAHMWINLAHSNSTYENDRKQSTNLLNDLERKMTPKQLFEAQKLSREWKPKERN